jgi:hypothetical protein
MRIRNGAARHLNAIVPSATDRARHQHYAYLNAQMRKLAEGYRHNLDQDLVLFLRSFDPRESSATADYLSRLAGPRRDDKKMRDDGVVVD